MEYFSRAIEHRVREVVLIRLTSPEMVVALLKEEMGWISSIRVPFSASKI
jgi:hypothetical protein